MTTLAADDRERLLRGTHSDPFAVLGPHRVEGAWVVRAMLPGARDAFVEMRAETAHASVRMMKIDDAGLFEARLGDAAHAPDYELRVVRHDGAESRSRDAYAFGPVASEHDLYLFGEGKLRKLYDAFGAHVRVVGGVRGVHFLVWAPAARRVSVIGDFNGWDTRRHSMRRLVGAGCWEIFIPGAEPGALYRYEIVRADGVSVAHSDPMAFRGEVPPKSASVVEDLDGYDWGDAQWMASRNLKANGRPMSMYEVHLGSWRRPADDPQRFYTYRELAELLPEYVERMGFTHVELMPVAEHPYYASWGYQISGYYAVTSRYGGPRDFMALVDAFHRRGIGVIMDWVPAHFPTDAWALARFDGTGQYEHIDPRQGYHQDWKTYIFNYGSPQVANFLSSNALFWIERFHLDGLRVDAVSSMLYLDYSRKEGEWVANKYGGRENLEAIDFLRSLNALIDETAPGAAMIAEESTSFTGVTRPSYLGGLGFHYKWNLGWMHDYLEFFRKDPIYRKHHTGLVTFALSYAWSERFIMVLGHDEVVHLKGSLLYKMRGDEWQKFAHLRALYSMMFALPGKKLLFMGSELAPWSEWNHDRGLEWEVLQYPLHAGVSRLVADLNHHLRNLPPLYELDETWEGFQWIDFTDIEQTTFSWIRYGSGSTGADGVDRREAIIFIVNLTPVPRSAYRIGVPRPGVYREVLNSDAAEYGGGGLGNLGAVAADAEPRHGHAYSIALTLPPLGALMFTVPAAPSAPPAEKSKIAAGAAAPPAAPGRAPAAAEPKKQSAKRPRKSAK